MEMRKRPRSEKGSQGSLLSLSIRSGSFTKEQAIRNDIRTLYPDTTNPYQPEIIFHPIINFTNQKNNLCTKI